MRIWAVAPKIMIIVYLASQAIADYDLFVVLYEWVTGNAVDIPYGLNFTNTLAFVLVAPYIASKELRRSKKIGYRFSPASSRHLEALRAQAGASSASTSFSALLDGSMATIVRQNFPPMIPLQLSDILTTRGFEFQADDESDDVLQYVEELSPMEVATNAALNWIRQEAQSKQFKLELYLGSDYDAVAVSSGNPDTDAYLCLRQNRVASAEKALPELADEAALRMFFEAESLICRDFEAFRRFYQLLQRLPVMYEKYGSEEFDAVHAGLIAEIDTILAVDPSFLTMQVLKGIVYFHDRKNSTQAFEQAQAVFENAIETAQEYYTNRRQARRQSLLPAFLRRTNTEDILAKPQISRRTMHYVQGLSEIFLGRLFSQSAHRFGSYDTDPQRFLAKRKLVEKRMDHGIRFLDAARRKVPFLAWVGPIGRKAMPFAYYTRGFICHCHDYFDKDEVFFRGRERRGRVADAVKDLERAIKVYSRGMALCGRAMLAGADDFARHLGTRMHNNCGYAQLYSCLIRGKLDGTTLRSQRAFELAEFNLYYASLESATFNGYPLANLGLLYALEGDWERSWQAGIVALDKSVFLKITAARSAPDSVTARSWEYSRQGLDEYRTLLPQGLAEAVLERPTLARPFAQSWSYVEGISELSYGFILRGLSSGLGHGTVNEKAECLQIGLAIHRRALELLIVDEIDQSQSLGDADLHRITNVMTNLIRAMWHFDDRTNPCVEGRLDSLHAVLHEKVATISAGWYDEDLTAPERRVLIRESIEAWLENLAAQLQGESGPAAG